MQQLLSLCLLVLLHVLLASAAKRSRRSKVPCTGTARFQLVWKTEWTEERFPKQFPKYRPAAQWSRMIGRTHDSSYAMWRPDEVASNAFNLFVSGRSDASILDNEPQGDNGIHDIFSGPRIRTGEGTSVSQFWADEDHSLVSMASKMVPSPDWFVGISDVPLCEGGQWVKFVKFDLRPYDAGVERGFAFSSPHWDLQMPEPISEITPRSQKHKASSFYYPQHTKLPRMGHLKIRLLETSAPAQTVAKVWAPKPKVQPQTDADNEVTEVKADCQVSEWGSWGHCSNTCGVGTRARTRAVLQQPMHGGSPCPLTEETGMCSTIRRCYSFRMQSQPSVDTAAETQEQPRPFMLQPFSFDFSKARRTRA